MNCKIPVSTRKYFNCRVKTLSLRFQDNKNMIFKYRKHFGIIRILLGILFLVFPVYEYLRRGGEISEESMTLLFVMVFYLMYSYSAIKNGIRELNNNMPSFDLFRFFEAAMNGFMGLFFLILTFSKSIAPAGKFFVFILAVLTIANMIRDLRLISIQYVEKRRSQSSK